MDVSTLRRCGAALAGAGLLWLLALPWLLPDLLALATRHVSGDHHVTERGATFFAATLITGGAVAIVIGIFTCLLARGAVSENLHRALGDERTDRRTYYTLAFSWTLGTLLVVCVAMLGGQGEIGPLEMAQLAVLLSAVCVLVRTAAAAGIRTPRGALHALLAAAVLVVAAEEVSWLLLRPNLSGLVAALIVSLLLALPDRWPAWFELQELCAYLLLLFCGLGNLASNRVSQRNELETRGRQR